MDTLSACSTIPGIYRIGIYVPYSHLLLYRSLSTIRCFLAVIGPLILQAVPLCRVSIYVGPPGSIFIHVVRETFSLWYQSFELEAVGSVIVASLLVRIDHSRELERIQHLHHHKPTSDKLSAVNSL